jgi:hypothetical protein
MKLNTALVTALLAFAATASPVPSAANLEVSEIVLFPSKDGKLILSLGQQA